MISNPPFKVDEIDADKVQSAPLLPFGLPSVNKKVEVFSITPEDFGLQKSKVIKCSGAVESAERIMKVFSGKKNEDTSFILMNSSAALYSSGIVKDFREGVEVAENAIAEGEVIEKIEEIKNASKT
ncbi:MAG TPA: hypothetical protein EYP30_04925 [Archaeoglobaceae archaeon]|nr:hypothetical protein [Archaeoglobaceae archaeon]